MKILVYGGEGVSSFTLQETLKTFRKVSKQVEVVDHHTLIQEEWEKETSLLIFPGGRDIPYDRHLKGKGTDKIQRFVKEGGSYLGICAGAYFGSAEVIFEKGTPIEVHEKRDLAFFPGAAVGTVYPHAPFSYESEEGTHAAKILFKNNPLYLYYNGGCTFKNEERHPNISILAQYNDADDQAAIIHCKVGKGNVILSGVHFEVCPLSLKKEGSDRAIIEKIKNSNSKREELITSLMKLLTPRFFEEKETD